MNFMGSRRPARDRVDGAAILTDRDLLLELDLSDALAANYLGKSRQALHVKLGARDGEAAPYFKISEIALLVMAAQQRGHVFDRGGVLDFAISTAGQRPRSSKESLKILQDLLGSSIDRINLDDAGTIFMILPDFADQRAALPELSRDLRDLAEEVAGMKPVPWIAVFSSTIVQARMAAEWLAFPQGKTKAFTHDNVDQLLPCILVFPRSGGAPRPYLLTELGGIVAAPQFRANVLAEYGRYMLPTDARAELFNYDEQVTPRKHG